LLQRHSSWVAGGEGIQDRLVDVERGNIDHAVLLERQDANIC
jgi:hypothetical protein